MAEVNFHFPVSIEKLQNERVKLVPFVPEKHADSFFAIAGNHPELFDYMPFGPFSSAEDFVSTFVEHRILPDPAQILFAVFDTSTASPPQLAGTIGLLDTSPVNLSTEIGFVITLPAFQRTHITTNAVGLLLHWTLDSPSAGGLGLRRVAWKANSLNSRSIRAAERLGFRKEGVLRWDRVLSVGKTEGKSISVRSEDPKPKCLGRDTTLLSLCWDDWEAGGWKSVDEMMLR
ncbi:acyl-CoA N-acyltransferase [Favolaschia claudopus]|uniref:Acyl-CoA N-acyltransferase n=1 Tax=Favolaschia claudopus TaxID=2862362 RepID=A0AAW0AUD7_9AGAR